ncbi:MAG: hypothetical protein AAF560_21990 [Acidobacteriota bacterium]
MSNYFRALLRLEKQSGSPGAVTARAAAGEAQARDPLADTKPVYDISSVKKQNAHAALLDALRAVTGREQTPTVVIAGVARSDAVGAVIAGIANQAAQRGVGVQIGDVVVSTTHRILSTREDTPEPRGLDPEGLPLAGKTSLPLELSAPATQEALKKWFVGAGAGYDLLIVAAPPLLTSVDAALVARACDGLVLVGEPLVTQRDEFEIAVERARSSGCRVLGLVMNDNQEWLPRFLGRLFGTYPRSILPEEKE